MTTFRNKEAIKNVKYVYLRPVVCLVYNNIDLNNIALEAAGVLE